MHIWEFCSTWGLHNWQLTWNSGGSSFILTVVAVLQILYSANMNVLLPSCFPTCMWNHSSEKYTNTCSTLDFVVSVYQTALCCGGLLLWKQIIVPVLNGISRLRTCAYYYHEQMLITSFFFSLEMFLTPVDGGPGLLLSMLGWSMGLCHVCCRGAFGSWGIIECGKVFNFS